MKKRHLISIGDYATRIDISTEILTGKSRFFKHSGARQAYWLYLRKHGLTYRRTGELFNRHYSTIISGVRTAENLIATKNKWVLFCLEQLCEESAIKF
jgi:hypothetical protein